MSGEGWEKVGGRKPKLGGIAVVRDLAKLTPKCLTEDEIKVFLASFKTQRCSVSDFHDARFCPDYHCSEKDQRRNPYEIYYDLGECRNLLETMYHPLVFRTTSCDRGNDCAFGYKCSHAHSDAGLRDRLAATRAFEKSTEPVESRKMPTVAAFVPERKNYQLECIAIWKEQRLKPATVFMGLDLAEWFIVQRCGTLFRVFEQVAFENGMGHISRQCQAGQHGLFIRGLDVDSIQACVQSLLLVAPSEHFSVEEREYGERVVDAIRDLLGTMAGKKKLAESDDVLLQVLDETRIRITGVYNAKTGVRGDALVQRVLQTIGFWVGQAGYAEFIECGCCTENRNPDQGVVCEQGHFYCSVEKCFDTAIRSQIMHLGSRECLICPNCKSTYDLQKIAPHLPPNTWDDVQKALVDRKVQQERDAIASEFDRRLEEKVREQFEKYGDASTKLKFKAQQEALVIRNSILNLSCPHCKTAYVEFTGCMALKCSTCEGNFCGYCHQASGTGPGSHEHVRQCLLNETNNGSYYAKPEEVEKAQKRYRTRELRKHLNGFKKNLQNAVVVELERELKDLDIQPAALFEFGNLQDELLEVEP